MNTTYGTLYAIGVGPGDPELLTLKAVRILGEADVIFTAASPKNTYSTARDIAMPHLTPGTETQRLEFPMTRDQAVLDEAWAKSAAIVHDVLSQGKTAVFLTLGDPMTYSTFGYLMKALQRVDKDIPMEVIPGITSFNAAAARTKTILCECEETLAVIPGIMDPATMEKTLTLADNAVILKAYRKFPEIKASLENTGLKEHSTLVSACYMPTESIENDLDACPEKPPYFSLVLVSGNNKE